MRSAYDKVAAPIINGLLLPLILYGFRVTPFSDPEAYRNAAILSLLISFGIYAFKKPKAPTHVLKRQLVNLGWSFFVLFVFMFVYFAILVAWRGFV